MADTRWKAAERSHARDVGTERIPVDGRAKHSADFENGLFCYQLKHRSGFPAYLYDWLDGIRSWAKPTDKIGVLVLNKPRRPRSEALVLLRWADWVALHGAVGESPDAD
jgi:hypothetical protein